MSEPNTHSPDPSGVVLITGFPGFIARRLLTRLATHPPEGQGAPRFVLLALSSMVAAAEATLRDLAADHPDLAERCRVVVGDLTEPDLGLAPAVYAQLIGEVTRVWHLAALYNLAVEESLAYRVNVLGTRHVLDFCDACAHFERLLYISTCYVSGFREGVIREVELDEGQSFKNHYESTKFWAEVAVRRRADAIPTVIFRPSIVVGDSITGATDKYDGPYTIIRFLERLPEGVPVPNLGSGRAPVNLAPIDYVVAAMQTIADQDDAVGLTFQLADPNPMPVHDVLELILTTLGKPPAVGAMPPWVADLALRIRPLRRGLQIPREALTYFNHDAHYDCSNTLRALEGTGVRCPHLSSYMDTLVDFMRRHPG